MEVITGNLSSQSSSSFTPYERGSCVNTQPSLIDDLHICGKDVPFDGEGGLLAVYGPRFLRRDPMTGKYRLVWATLKTIASSAVSYL